MSWNLSKERPIYIQLVDKLQILSGHYRSLSGKFPSVRELATEAAVNPNTMQKALAALEQEGLLIGSRTNGRTVTSDASLIGSMRDELADGIVENCYQALAKLGFSKEECIACLRKQRKEDL
mgnify:CR=1 FL=1